MIKKKKDIDYLVEKTKELEDLLLTTFRGDQKKLQQFFSSQGFVDDQKQNQEDKEDNEVQKQREEREKFTQYRANPVLYISTVLTKRSSRLRQMIKSLETQEEEKKDKKPASPSANKPKSHSALSKELRLRERKEKLRAQLKKSYLVAKSKKLLRLTLAKGLASYLIALSLHPLDTVILQLQTSGLPDKHSTFDPTQRIGAPQQSALEVARNHPNLWAGVSTLNKIWLYGVGTQLVASLLFSLSFPYIHSSHLALFRDQIQLILPQEQVEQDLIEFHSLQDSDQH